MKDALGRDIKLGDAIVYVSRYGSSVSVSKREVVEVHEQSIKAKYLDTVWGRNEAGEYVGRPVEKVALLRTPHLVVILERP